MADCETAVNLIAGTTAATAPSVTCRPDRRRYSVGRKVTEERTAGIAPVPDDFRGDWNHTIQPRPKS